MLYFNQRLVYCGLLTPVHGTEFELLWGKPASPGRSPGQAPVKKRAPPLLAGLFNVNGRSYLAGAVVLLPDVDFVCLLLLWCCFEDEDLCELDLAGAESEAGAGSAASTGPAIRARAIKGTSFLNIDVVSRVRNIRSFTLAGA